MQSLFKTLKEENYKFALTADSWVSKVNQQEYLAITIHYYDQNLQLNSKVIGMEYLDERHIDKYLFKSIKKVLEDLNILDNIIW